MRTENLLGKLLKDSVIYGGSDALVRMVAFVTFPIIAGALSADGFGVLELAMTMVTMGGVIARCGMNNAAQRFYWDPLTPDEQRPDVVTAGLVITIALGIVLGSVIYIFHQLVLRYGSGHVAAIGTIGAVGLALLVPLTPWTQYVQDVLRLHFVPWRFMMYSFVTRAFSAVLAAFAAVLYQGPGGVLFAQALVLLVSLPLGLWLIKRDLTRRIDRVWAQRLFTYGAPFILTEAAFWLFSSIDRWMLAAMVGPQETGIYSAAFRISVLVSFVSMAFGMAWSPYAVKLQGEYPTRFKAMYAEILLLLLVVMLAIGGGVALFSSELILLILPEEYSAASAALPVLAFCVIIQASQQVTAVGISMSGKTHLFVYLVWATAGINILLNLPLIQYHGVVGSAWATLISHLLLTISYLVCSSYVYPIPFPIPRLLGLCALAAGLLGIALRLQVYEPSIGLSILKLVLLLACLLLALRTLRLQDLLHLSEK
jgi:O-antigen/teichoic acid export membrane protein